MKVLYLGYYDEGCVANRCKVYLRKALTKHAEVICYGPKGFPNWTGTIDVAKLEKTYKPDVILFQGFWTNKYDMIWRNVKTNIPKVIFVTDAHRVIFGDAVYKRFINKYGIDMSLWDNYFFISRCKNMFFKGHKLKWLPWSVDTNIFKDYKLNREYDVGFLGIINETYPFRKQILKSLRGLHNKKQINLFYKQRPPVGLNLNLNNMFVDEKYARGISKCKMFIWGNGSLKALKDVFSKRVVYAIQKYFESMATNTLTLAPTPTDAFLLHFKSKYNFVDINRNNFIDVIIYYLQNKEERLKIAKNGFETIKKYHTSEIRAKQLYNYLQEVIK